MKDKMQIFEQKEIRSHWDEEQEKWYFFYCRCGCRTDR